MPLVMVVFFGASAFALVGSLFALLFSGGGH
jgi:hypothetical protein